MSAIFASDQVASAVFDGDGATRIFPFSFRIFSPDDVRVLVDGVAITTGFHVGMATASSALTGGVVTFAMAPLEGQHIRIERRLGLRRLSTYDSGSSLRADALNADFDFMVAALGDVQNAVGQSLRLPDMARGAGVSAQLPAIDPGRAILWNAAGDGLANGPNADEIATAASHGATAASAATRAEVAGDRAETAFAGFVAQSAPAVMSLDFRDPSALAYQDERRMPMIDAPNARILDIRESGSLIRASNGARIDLPAVASSRNGVRYRVFNGDGTIVDVRAAGADILRPVDGGAEVSVYGLPSRGDAVDVICDGVRWHVQPVHGGAPVVKLLRNAAQTIPADGDFIVEWDSVIADSHGLYSASYDGIANVPPGFYLIDIGVCLEVGADPVQGKVYLERQSVDGWHSHLEGLGILASGNGARQVMRCSGLARAGAGADNAFRVRVAHSASDSRQIPATDLSCWFHAVRVAG